MISNFVLKHRNDFQQILLIPHLPMPQNPCLRIIPRRENIVRLYDDARGKGPQQLQVFVQNVALWTNNV